MELKSLTLNGKTYDRFASDVLIVTTDVNVASHSASEIKAAAEAGKTVFINSDGSPLPLSTYSEYKATFVEPMSNTTTGSFGEMRVFVDNKKELTYELKSFKVYSKDQTDEKIASAVEDALTQAKANGDFKGDPGKDGADGKDGQNGSDYVLTDADKQEIAEQAAEMVEIPEGGNVELDTTLTASGKAADAKAVGDSLNGKLSTKGGTMTGKIVFPTGDQNAGFANSQDMKIFGYGTFNGAMHMRMGDTQYPFQIRGNGERAKYNDSEIALMGDIPTDEHINSLINTALGVIENGTY